MDRFSVCDALKYWSSRQSSHTTPESVSSCSSSSDDNPPKRKRQKCDHDWINHSSKKDSGGVCDCQCGCIHRFHPTPFCPPPHSNPSVSSFLSRNPHSSQLFLVSTAPPSPLSIIRLLNDSAPTAPYRSRRGEYKSTIAWGQRKLLIEECEFLLKYHQCGIDHIQWKSSFSLAEWLKKNKTPDNDDNDDQINTSDPKTQDKASKNEVNGDERCYATNDLMKFLNDCIVEKKDCECMAAEVLYVGAAPGHHLLLISYLFPCIQFVLYDPRPFAPPLYHRSNIRIHQKYFDDQCANEIAQRWSSSSSSTDCKNYYFISDIRTSLSTNDDEQRESVDQLVAVDMIDQQRWHCTLRPTASLLKFRLPYSDPDRPDARSCYLAGDLFFQSFAPLTSTETRLVPHPFSNKQKNDSGFCDNDQCLTCSDPIIQQSGASVRRYHNKRYEEQLFYFNCISRAMPYQIGQSCTHDHNTSLDNCYDCSIEKMVLLQLMKRKGMRIDDDECIIALVYSFSQFISEALSIICHTSCSSCFHRICRTLQSAPIDPNALRLVDNE